ncbi:hypothetical protein [Lysobacter enzymogenes]|uniref:hypothetical protein n=1 Tax=Lysobacter enzymogenes TaxID=69 RepID=UPI0011160B0E|nr:hypothetical protein [Lysobacter enzymogenes]UZW62357.1 hypothetical protein BV903_008745 [Lysobacter enzymogenes]
MKQLAIDAFREMHGRPPQSIAELNEALALMDTVEVRARFTLASLATQETANVLPFRFNPRRTYPVVRDRTGMQAVDELIAAHLGLESAGAFKGVEARFGASYERLPEAQAQEALRWGIQAERGALAVRQFLKELEGRFLESLAEQLAPPKAARRRKQSPKSQAAKGGGADA